MAVAPGYELPTSVGDFINLPPINTNTPAGQIADNIMAKLYPWLGSYVVAYWSVWLPFLLALVVLFLLVRRIGIAADDMLVQADWQSDVEGRIGAMDAADDARAARKLGIYSRGV